MADFGGGSEIKTGEGPGDAYVVLLRNDGSYGKTWEFGGISSTSIDAGYGIAVDSTGNKYVTGLFLDTVDFREDWPGAADSKTSAGSYDAFIMKFK